MIKLNNIVKKYSQSGTDVFALKGITLDVKPGEIFGIIGRSGAGKSTLVRTINLLEQPSSGSILIDGKDITHLRGAALREERHEIGMIFQHFNLLSSQTVYHNIALPLVLKGMSKAQIKSKIDPIIELTGLSEHVNKYPHQLSGGQKQRVGIARALSYSPKVLLCDEATSALDPKTSENILELLSEINQRLKITMLIITHEMEVVKHLCDRVGLLHQGELVEVASTIDFFSAPKSPQGAELVKTAARMELPSIIADKLYATAANNRHAVIKIIYKGTLVSQPVLGNLVKGSALNINIMQANIEIIGHNTVGTMILELMGEMKDLEFGIKHLESQALSVEVLGYVDAVR